MSPIMNKFYQEGSKFYEFGKPTKKAVIASIYFQYNKWILDTHTDKKVLDELIEKYSKIVVEKEIIFGCVGYADYRGDDIYNQRLSEKRADSVANYLKNAFNDVSSVKFNKNVVPIGMGEHNSIRKTMHFDRRVDITSSYILKPEDKWPPLVPIPIPPKRKRKETRRVVSQRIVKRILKHNFESVSVVVNEVYIEVPFNFIPVLQRTVERGTLRVPKYLPVVEYWVYRQYLGWEKGSALEQFNEKYLKRALDVILAIKYGSSSDIYTYDSWRQYLGNKSGKGDFLYECR